MAGANDAVQKQMDTLAPIQHNPALSPDELLHTTLAGDDDKVLSALEQLCGVQMLGDYVLRVALSKRRLELAELNGENMAKMADPHRHSRPFPSPSPRPLDPHG